MKNNYNAQLLLDYEINYDRRTFLFNAGKKLSVSALLLAGFVPLDSDANPVLLARVVAGAVAKHFGKKEISKFISKTSEFASIGSAIHAIVNRDVKVTHLASNEKISTSKVDREVKKVEKEIPDAIWSQSGNEKANEDSNIISVIIANNSGKTVNNVEPIIAKIIDIKKTKESEVKVAVKPKKIKPGITIHEVKVSSLPKKGVKKVRMSHKSKKIPELKKVKNIQALSSNKVVIASNEEVKDVRTKKMSGTRLFEKYVSYNSSSIINTTTPASVPNEVITPHESTTGCLTENGSGSRGFNKYIGCNSG